MGPFMSDGQAKFMLTMFFAGVIACGLLAVVGLGAGVAGIVWLLHHVRFQ